MTRLIYILLVRKQGGRALQSCPLMTSTLSSRELDSQHIKPPPSTWPSPLFSLSLLLLLDMESVPIMTKRLALSLGRDCCAFELILGCKKWFVLTNSILLFAPADGGVCAVALQQCSCSMLEWLHINTLHHNDELQQRRRCPIIFWLQCIWIRQFYPDYILVFRRWILSTILEKTGGNFCSKSSVTDNGHESLKCPFIVQFSRKNKCGNIGNTLSNDLNVICLTSTK